MLLHVGQGRWIVATLLLVVVATAVYLPYARAAQHGPSGGSVFGLVYGTTGLALMVYAGVLGLRRKVPAWRIGRATTWMKGHLWLGLVSYVLILFHSGFQLGGALTVVLMALFTLVVLSGLYGVVLQQFLPRMLLSQVPLETVYEQIDSVVGQLRGEADELVAAATGVLRVAETMAPGEPRGGGGLPRGEQLARPSPRPKPREVAVLPESTRLREIYLADVRPFLAHDLPRNGRLERAPHAAALFQHLRLTLPAPLHDTVDELQAICDERRQLARQQRLHHWLHGWLLLHVPLSMALLLLAVAHAIISIRY